MPVAQLTCRTAWTGRHQPTCSPSWMTNFTSLWTRLVAQRTTSARNTIQPKTAPLIMSGGGDGILQSAIRQGNRGMGAQMQRRSQPQRHPRRHAPARSHRHTLVPTIHSQPCGGQVPQRPTPVRDERHTGRPGAIPQHDRRNAHRRKMKEGER